MVKKTDLNLFLLMGNNYWNKIGSKIIYFFNFIKRGKIIHLLI
jgi:hypothetical protein